MVNEQIILELKDIDKRFGGVHALDHVSFDVHAGEIHAIVGENGAGKSTLMKILAGTYQQDQGTIRLNGNEVCFTNPRAAYQAGINIVYQEFYKFPALDVAANIFAGRELSAVGLLSDREMRKRAEQVFQRMQVDIDISTPVKDLSVAQQQLVEIAKALVYQGSIVIMDEPNSSLTDKETQALFDIIRRLKDEGMTILYISHRLEEVFNICDRITVMRDGRHVGTWRTDETSVPFIISQMIGRSIDHAFPPVHELSEENSRILEVKKLCQKENIMDISFDIREGEVLGFAGLEGCGVRNLFEILFGLERADSGEVIYLGKRYKPTYSCEAIDRGWAMIPANRRDHGLFLKWSIKENMSIVILKRLLNFLRLLNDRNSLDITESFIRKLNISTDSIDKKVFDLSGGNQQKVVIAKWLASEPRVLILDDPTRGIDVGAKAEIYQLIQELAGKGIAILLNSSEIDEIINLSNRVMVMRSGRIIKEFSHQKIEKVEMMRYVSGDLSQADAATAGG